MSLSDESEEYSMTLSSPSDSLGCGRRFRRFFCGAPSSTAWRMLSTKLTGVLKKTKPMARRQFLATAADAKALLAPVPKLFVPPPGPMVIELE